MRLHEQTASTASAPGLQASVRVQLQTFAVGRLELDAAPEHRLLVHAGEPTRGTCRHQRFTYSRGDVDILPAGMSDACQHEDVGTWLVLQLAPSLLQRAAQDMGRGLGGASLQPRYQLRDPQIEHIAWALDAERKAGHPNGRLYVDSLGLALAVHLLGRSGVSAPLRSGLSNVQLERVTQYIEAYIDRDLSLPRLADVAEVSATQLKRGFRASTGMAVHQYVVQRRVERAKRLFLENTLPASQIALEAGFAHQSHMARCMRRVLGITPRDLT